MFYLIFSILFSTFLNIVIRLGEDHVQAKTAMLSFNYLACVICAACFAGPKAFLPVNDGAGTALLLGAVSGFFYVVGLVLLQTSCRKNGIVLSSVFSKLGAIMFPFLLSIAFFSEVPDVFQIIGAVIAMIAIVLINLKGKQNDAAVSSETHPEHGSPVKKNESRTGSVMLLIWLFVGEGCASSMGKIFKVFDHVGVSDQFLLYNFFFALLICSSLVIYRKEHPGIKEALYGFAFGIPNYFTARLILRALETVPAMVVYPVQNVSVIVLVALSGIILFKEKLTKLQWIAVGTILIAVALLNL